MFIKNNTRLILNERKFPPWTNPLQVGMEKNNISITDEKNHLLQVKQQIPICKKVFIANERGSKLKSTLDCPLWFLYYFIPIQATLYTNIQIRSITYANYKEMSAYSPDHTWFQGK